MKNENEILTYWMKELRGRGIKKKHLLCECGHEVFKKSQLGRLLTSLRKEGKIFWHMNYWIISPEFYDELLLRLNL